MRQQMAIKEVPAEEVATWLVVGFKRCWLLREVLDACGLPAVDSPEDAAAMHEKYPFLPALIWSYVGRNSTPVRALVSFEWPRLHQFLDANTTHPEKLALAPKQIVKLRCRDVQRLAQTKEDKKEAARNKYVQNRASASSVVLTNARKSHGRSAWNVCKK